MYRVRTDAADTITQWSVLLGTVLFACAALLIVLPSTSSANSAKPNIASQLAPTRFVVLLDRPVDFEVLSLTNPNRVVISLPDVKMRLPAGGEDAGAGLVKSFRGGVSAPGQARVVIDVRAPVIVRRSEIQKHGRDHQLVVDLVPAPFGKLPAQTAAKRPLMVQPPLPRPASRPEEIVARSYKPVIVIDPGHGGHDTGAKKNGVVEKDVVLAFSKVLRDKLESTGRYRVLMTRDKDVFITLDGRREIAERNKAALFIAVHADYAGAHARGATIYSLRDSTAAALQRSAKSEVVKTVLTNQELSG